MFIHYRPLDDNPYHRLARDRWDTQWIVWFIPGIAKRNFGWDGKESLVVVDSDGLQICGWHPS